jgi:D-amino peptidase
MWRQRTWKWLFSSALIVGIVAAGTLAMRAQKPTKVLILFDMEGLRVAEHAGEYEFDSPKYNEIRKDLGEEVNAAARGVLKAGAQEVVISDCHASGNVETSDYPTDQIPKGARLDIRDQPYDPYVEGVTKEFDAILMIGMHAKAGDTKGFVPHTYFGTVRWNVHGLDMSETSMVAFSADRFHIPFVLVTGDDTHKPEVADFMNAEYVVVKDSQSLREAKARSKDEVLKEIEDKAEKGFRNRKNYKVTFQMPKPLVSTFKFSMAEATADAIAHRGIVLVDDRTVSYTASDYLDALWTYKALSADMRMVPAQVMLDRLAKMEGGQAILQKLRADMPPRVWDGTGQPLVRIDKLAKWGYQ